MNDMEARLAACFKSVFPDLPREDVAKATPDSVEGWDSVATVTLFAVIEEEFNTELSIEDLKVGASYEVILNCLKAKLQNVE